MTKFNNFKLVSFSIVVSKNNGKKIIFDAMVKLKFKKNILIEAAEGKSVEDALKNALRKIFKSLNKNCTPQNFTDEELLNFAEYI